MHYLSILILILWSAVSSAQNERLIIRDQLFAHNGGVLEPLPFATVVVNDGTMGCVTDFDGRFQLDLTSLRGSAKTATLRVQFLGFSPIELVVDLDDGHYISIKNFGQPPSKRNSTSPGGSNQKFRWLKRLFRG